MEQTVWSQLLIWFLQYREEKSQWEHVMVSNVQTKLCYSWLIVLSSSENERFRVTSLRTLFLIVKLTAYINYWLQAKVKNFYVAFGCMSRKEKCFENRRKYGNTSKYNKKIKKFDRNRNSYGREFCGACWLKGNNFQKEDQGWQTSLYN